ncbi:hypothetical protein [Streptomyces laculatispora]|uniref:hypothetical protein n=1 Tax=Streptomyces laculatispora TaxID=887464 RepID=UPI0027DE94BE|nr:hypothetical protein [Streptomyces laculatispora]
MAEGRSNAAIGGQLVIGDRAVGKTHHRHLRHTRTRRHSVRPPPHTRGAGPSPRAVTARPSIPAADR